MTDAEVPDDLEQIELKTASRESSEELEEKGAKKKAKRRKKKGNATVEA